MDWHFRRNRKEKESEGRGANRRWLPRAEAWIKDVTTNLVSADGSNAATVMGESDGALAPNGSGAVKLDAAGQARRTRELQESWVSVPSSSSKAALPCPICKEKFVSEYNEDEEEWVWRNAVEADGQVSLVFNTRCNYDSIKVKLTILSTLRIEQIFHATCRADAVASAVANRIIGSDSNRTRSQSPVVGSRGTTPQPPTVKPSPLVTSTTSQQDHTPGDASPAAPGQSPRPAHSDMVQDVKPTAAQLLDMDSVAAQGMPGSGHSRQGSTESVNGGGAVKRKAEEDVDGMKEVKKEKP